MPGPSRGFFPLLTVTSPFPKPVFSVLGPPHLAVTRVAHCPRVQKLGPGLHHLGPRGRCFAPRQANKCSLPQRIATCVQGWLFLALAANFFSFVLGGAPGPIDHLQDSGLCGAERETHGACPLPHEGSPWRAAGNWSVSLRASSAAHRFPSRGRWWEEQLLSL